MATALGAQASPDSAAVYNLLTGTWLGALEYRDFSSNSRVRLPALLTVTRVPDGDRFEFAFDDGNGKVVRDKDLRSFDKGFSSYAVFDSEAREPDVYTIATVTGFNGAGGGRFVAMGSGTEGNKPVEVRETVEVGPNTLVLLRETRPAGSPGFAFRDRYAFSRIK